MSSLSYDAPVVEGTRSKIGDYFLYNSYWHTWSRILRRESFSQLVSPDARRQVEIDLTAVNPTTVTGWAKVASGNIRAHYTPARMGDMLLAELPPRVLRMMQNRLTGDTIEFLLHADILPCIDWSRHQKATNGGASWEACRKTR